MRANFTLVIRDKSGRLRAKRRFQNTVTKEGLALLAPAIVGLADAPAFYIGLIDASGFTAVSSSDTAGSHAWSELTVYDQSTRPEANYVAVGAVQAFPQFTFDGITVSPTVQGAFVVTSSVKGGTGGTLWAAAVLDEPLSLHLGDSLSIGYSTGLGSVIVGPESGRF